MMNFLYFAGSLVIDSYVEMYHAFWGQYSDSWDHVFGVLAILFVSGLYALGIFLIFLLGLWIWETVFFHYAYSEVLKSAGKVTNMKYEHSKTYYNGKTTTYVPEKNLVYFKTPQAKTCLDSDLLYQHVRVSDNIKVHYQVIYQQPRFWRGLWSPYGMRLIQIDTKSLDVCFNDPKAVLPRI